MILDQIIAYKRIEVAQAMERTPVRELEQAVETAPPTRGFAAKLRRPGPETPVRVVAEIKKASPSKGVIRPDFDPERFAVSYENNGATAISVLTDEKFFQGGLNILRAVRQTVDVPILRKEFIIDPFQIVEARAAGADAILLIVACLKDREIVSLREMAESLDLDCLVEAHTRDEAQRAADTGATLIGINNRNLNTFETDVRHTEQILPAIPDTAIIVSESGIQTAADVAYLAGLGAHAILVGETLMRRDDPGTGIPFLLGLV